MAGDMQVGDHLVNESGITVGLSEGICGKPPYALYDWSSR